MLLKYLFLKIYDHLYIAESLIKIGTKKSLDYVKLLIEKSKNNQTKSLAIEALEKIDGKNQFDFYVKNYNVSNDIAFKIKATSYLIKHDRIELIPIFIKRVKQLLTKERSNILIVDDNDQPELVKIISFLFKI